MIMSNTSDVLLMIVSAVCDVMQHGACVNVADLWKFTPLHEAAAKGKFEICRLLLKVGSKQISLLWVLSEVNTEDCIVKQDIADCCRGYCLLLREHIKWTFLAVDLVELCP